MIQQESNDKFEILTNRLTVLARFLIFIVAFPGIVGVIVSGITLLFYNEVFLQGPYNLGFFLLGITTTLPIFYYLFLKIWKKEIWIEITPLSYKREFRLGVLLIYIPSIVTSVLFFALSYLLDYPTFSFEFQFYILTIMPLESWFFCKFYKILFPIVESKSDFSETRKILVDHHQLSLQRIISKAFLIKVFIDIVCLFLTKSALIIIIFNVAGASLYFGIKQLVFKLKNRSSDFKLMLNLKLLGYVLILQSIIQLWLSLWLSEFWPQINLIFYIIITTLITLKISIILFHKSISSLFIGFKIRVKWFIAFIINDFLSIALFFTGIIYVIVYLEIYSEIILIAICVLFLIENRVEKYFHFSNKLISSLFFAFQLLTIYAIISFLIIPVKLFLQTIIFSLLTITIPLLLFELKSIKKKTKNFIQNLQLIIVFYEIGVYLAFTTVAYSLILWDFLIFNYIFFISLSSLSTLYLLYGINIKGSRTNKFSILLVFFLLISFFGLFLIIEGALHGILSSLLEFLKNITPIQLFSPTGFLSKIHEFISTDGLIVCLAGLVTMVGYYSILELHARFKVISPYVSKFNKILSRFVLSLIICIIILITFQSISGILLSLMLGTFLLSYIYESYYNFKKFIQKPPKTSIVITKRNIFVINSIVSLFLYFFIGLEILNVNITLAFNIALIGLMVQINFVQKLKNILDVKIKDKSILHLINAISLILSGILAFPSLISLDSSFVNLEDLVESIVIFTLILLPFLKFALKQFYIGNFLKEKKHAYLNLITVMVFLILATVSGIKLTLDKLFIIQDYLIPLIISAFLIVSSFIFLFNVYLNKKKKYQGIYLIWHFSTSFIWQLSLIGLLTSSLIFSINSLENLILVFLGLFGFGIITRRNILYTSEIKRDFTYNIQSSKIFSNRKGLITRIGEIIRFINIISFLCFIYTSLTVLYDFLTPEALAISLSILLLLVYLVPEFKKYIKKQVFRIFNSIYILGFTVLTILSINLEFRRFGVHIFQEYLIYSIFFCLILTFSSILIIIDQLIKGEYISDRLNEIIHFICVFGIFYSIYSIIISIFFDPYIALFDVRFNLLYIFSPLFLLYFIFYVFELKKSYQTVTILDRILKWHNLALWTISSLGLIFSVIIISWYQETILTFGIFLASWSIYYSIKQLKSIILKYEKILSLISEYLIYINIIALSLAIFFFTQEFFEFPLLFSLFITLICLIGVLYTPFYQTEFLKKIISRIISLLVFVSSIILALSISFDIGITPPHNYFEILLIPIAGIFLSIYVLKERVISKNLAFKFNQINELILFLDIGIIVFMWTNSLHFGLSLLISSFSLSILLFIDYLTIKLLTNRDTLLISFFTAFLLCSIGISITVSSLLYPIFQELFQPDYNTNLKDKVTTFIFVQLFSTFWILKFVQTVYVKKIDSQDQKKSRIDDDKTDSDEIQISMSNDGENNGGSYVFPKKLSKFSPIFIMNKFAERVCNQWNLLEIGFIVVTMALNIFFGVNLIFSPIDTIDIFLILIQIFLLGILITTIFTLYEPKSQKFIYYYIQTLASILLNFAITWLFNYNLLILVIIPFVLAIIINYLATRNSPLNNIVKYVQNMLVLGLYVSILIHYGFPLHWILLISSIVFNFFTHRRYLNMTFNSFKVWAFAYFTYYILNGYLNQTNYELMSIFAACAVGLTWQWIVFLKDSKWSNSIIKSILGYIVTISWIFNYGYLFITDPTDTMGLISPPIMAVSIVSLILLKKKVKIFYRENFLNVLIMLSSFFMIYTLGMFYLFKNLDYNSYFDILSNSEILSISLSGAICGFLYIFIFQYLEFKVNKKWIVTSLMSGSLLGGIFMFFLLSEPNLTDLPYTIALPIAVDLSILMFFIAIGIYKHSFKNIWSVGVYAWTIVPLFNFLLISDLLEGMKNLTDALTVTNTDISIHGSYIISIILCSLLYLPIILTKLKENLNKLVYAFWLELLILIMWGGINLFAEPELQIPFTCLIGLILLVPIYVYFKKWRLLTIIWPFTAAANIFFVLRIFDFAQEPEWAIPLGTLIIGYYLLAFGYFPNIRKKPRSIQSIIIISGYFIVFGSIFALIYLIVITIIFPGLDPTRTVNLTFLVMSFVLLTAKYFNMRDYIIKVVHALIFIINSAILIGVTFWLIPGELDFKLFGIFLAIAFALGTTLSFQARKYIPKVFFELIWFGMALFFGLSVSALLIEIYNIGGWASTGVLLIITVLICIPIIRSFMGVAFVLLISGVSMIIMQSLVGFSEIIKLPQPIMFLDILLVFELTYIYLTRNNKISLLKDKKRIFETISVIWFIFTIIFSITLTFLVNFFIQLNFIFISSALIFLNVFALHNLLIERFIRKNEIFHQFEAVNKILNISHNILFYTIYLSISIFSAIHIPVPNIFYSLSIFFLISFIEFYLIDQYQVKAISPKIRSQLDWILFFAFSICLVVGISIYYKIWYISLLLWSLLFFVTIYLNLKAGNKIYPEILKFVNVILLNIGLFSLLFNIFEPITWEANPEFDFLFLNLVINLTITYLFMRFKIINNKAIYGFKIALALTISLYCEEISRIYFQPEIGFIFNLAIFLTILSLLVTREIRSTILIYCYWTILSFCSAIYILELTKRIYGDFNSPINQVIWFFFLFGAFTTTIYYCLANRVFVKSEKDDFINNEPNPEMNSKPNSSHSILMGHPNQKNAKQIYSTCFFIETAIVSISIAQGWSYLYNIFIPNITQITTVFYWISMIPLVSLTLLAYNSHYIFKHKLWSEKNYLRIGLPHSYENFKFGAVLGLVSFIFIHLWPVLDIWGQIVSLNFDMLTLNLAINLGILYLLMRFKVIRDRWIFGVSLILSLIISLTLEESYRRASTTEDFSILLTIAIFLFTLAILNTRNIKSSKMAYGYWASIAYSISALIFTIFNWENLDFQFALLNFLFIFVGLFTGIIYILAHRIIKTDNENILLIGHQDQIQAKKNFIVTALIDLPISAILISVIWKWLYSEIILFNTSFGNFIQFFNQLNIILILISAGLVKTFQYIRKNQLWFENEQLKKILEYAWNINGIYFYIGLPVSISSHLHHLLVEIVEIKYAITLTIFFFLFISFICIYYFDLKRAKILTQRMAKTLSISILILFGANLSIMWSFLTEINTWMFLIFAIFLYTLKIFKLVEDPILYWILIVVNLTITLSIYIEIVLLLFKSVLPWAFALAISLAIFHIIIEVENRLHKLIPSKNITQIVRNISWILLSIAIGLIIAFYDNNWNDFLNTLIRILSGISYLTLMMFYENFILFKQDNRKYIKVRNILGQLFYLELLSIIAIYLYPINGSIGITDENPLLFIPLFLTTELIVIAYFFSLVDKYILKFLSDKARKPINYGLFISTIVLGAANLGIISFIKWDKNLALSGLIFLITCYPVSPEKGKDTTPLSFALKIIYRALVVACGIGVLIWFIPDIVTKRWIITLLILAFFGYIIWIVRRSEELYNLPIYWRFISSLGAIIDFIITVVFLIMDGF